MNSADEIVKKVAEALNAEGEKWNLHFQVSPVTQPDGGWLQVFIQSDAVRSNSAAERQIISQVESDLSDEFGQELLLASVESVSALGV